jgi:hypothetical protein
MRIRSRIGFHLQPTEAEKVITAKGFKVNAKDSLQIVELFTDDRYYKELTDYFLESNIKYTEFKEKVFSKEEFKSAELMYIFPIAFCGYPQPEENFSYKKMTYNESSGCNKCLNGLIQNKFFSTKKLNMGKNDIAALYWVHEFIITNKLRELIENAKFTGCEFWPVLQYKKNIKFDNICQLYISDTMESLSPKTVILGVPKVETCECRKKGYMVESQLVYKRKALENIKDFNKTNEWFGGGETTWQLPIVSKRVYDLFVKHKVKGVKYEPVMIED